MFKLLWPLLLLSSSALAQVTPMPADSVADSMCLNVHNEIFPNHNAHTPPNYAYNYTAAGYGSNNQFYDVTLPTVKAAGVRCLRVGASAPAGDGGGHQTEFNHRMQTENMLGFKLTTVTGANQTNINNYFTLDGGWDKAEGQNEPDFYESCATIIADQKNLWNAIRTDTSPAIAALPILGPSLTVLRDVAGSTANWLKVCPTFAGIANVGNWHTYIHTVNPEAQGWDHQYFKNCQALFPSMPCYATEYGYASIQPGGVADAIHMPDNLITRYVPRWVLTKLQIGYTKGYWHQVADGYTSPQGGNAGYGLFFDYFGNPKPQGVAFGNMIHLFEDPAPFTPTPISYTITRKSGNIVAPQAMMFEKSNGKHLLAIWLGLPGWDGTKPIAVASELVAVQVQMSFPSLTVHIFNDDGTVTTAPRSAVNGLFDVTVTDHLKVFEF